MLVRKYADKPAMWAPDPGEIIYARRADGDKFVLAAVEKVWRNRAGFLRIRVIWFEDDPDASPGEADRNDRDGIGENTKASYFSEWPIEAGDIGWITVRQSLGETPLIRQVDAYDLPRKLVKKRPS